MVIVYGIVQQHGYDGLAIDATALSVLEDLFRKTKKDGTVLVLSGVHAQPLVALGRSGLLAQIGEENAHMHIDDALNRAREILGLPLVARAPSFAREAARDPRGDEPSTPGGG